MAVLTRPARPPTRLPIVARAVRAFVISAAFFAAGAVVIPVRDYVAADVVLGVVYLATVAAAARRWGPLPGVPLAIAAGLAIDSFVIPPTRPFDSEDWQNALVIAVYLVLGTVVGAIVARTQEKALAAETARGMLADEQAALRRVATLVARESPPEHVFDAVAEEIGRLLGVDRARLVRPDATGNATVVAAWNAEGSTPEPGRRLRLDGDDVVSRVVVSGQAGRSISRASSDLVDLAPGESPALVGAPVGVDGRLWGVLVVAARGERTLPADTESRVAQFADLVATAISNVEARTELAASRARLVVANDAERHRVVRDLHDGAQQRLVHTVVTLKLAKRALGADDLAAPMVDEAITQAEQATAELRDLVHGIMPAALTRRGLRSVVDELAVRAPIPIERSVQVDRLPATIEATAYFVIAEALTNVVKHARASSAAVVARVEHGELVIEIRDNGSGGAHPDGSGLVGLNDRLSALGGRLTVHSPPSDGTTVTATIPLAASDQ